MVKNNINQTDLRLTSDLNLNGLTPTRVQPKLGVWGPQRVISTARKKVHRWLVYVVFALLCAALLGFGYYIYRSTRP